MFKHSLRFSSLWVSGCVALAAFTSSTYAADELEPVFVSASRSTSIAESLPVGQLIIDRQTIEQSSATTLPDLLSEFGGVHTLKINADSNAGANVDLLGFGSTAGQNTLILLDGQRITPSDLSSVDFSAIPLNAIERIEILPASGSVLYGLGAAGGSINIVTREKYKTGSKIEVGGGSYQSRYGAVDGAVTTGQLSAFIAASAARADGYRDNSNSTLNNVFGNVRFQSNAATIYLSTVVKQQDLRLPGALPFNATDTSLRDDPTAASTPNNWSEDNNVTVLPGMSLSLTDQLTLITDGSIGRREQSFFYDDYFGGDFTSYTETQTDTYSVTPRLQWKVATGFLRHNLVAGVDLRNADYTSRIAHTEQTFDVPIHVVNMTQREHSHYVLDVIGITEKFSSTLGYRMSSVRTDGTDQYNAGAPAPTGSTDTQASPASQRLDTEQWQVGVRYFVTEVFDLFASVEESGRVANVNEIFEQKYDSGTATNFSTFDVLNAQNGRTYSTGANWRMAEQYSTLLFWQGDYDNEIIFNPASFENTNSDPTRRKGVSLNTRWQLDKTTWLTLAGSFQNATFRSGQYEGSNAPVVPEKTFFARFDWQLTSWVDLALAHTYVGSKYFENDQSNQFGQRIPSYRYTDVIARGHWRNLYGSLGVYNLEDKNNFDFGVSGASGNYNGYPLPDRHFRASVGMTF
ncbi:MAG: TonB-dependent receptor [Alcanivoracaceae bacterium]|nr:TonB-dependent receptor [Alcanivoracaceae bacterium]